MIGLIRDLAQAPATSGLRLSGEGRRDVFIAYRELHDDILRAASMLVEQGVAPGLPVVLPFVTSYEAIVAFMALIAVGAVPYSVKPAQVAGSRLAYQEFLNEVRNLHGVQTMMDWTDSVGFTALSIKGFKERGAAALALVDAVATDRAFVQFSSGSTAFPRVSR